MSELSTKNLRISSPSMGLVVLQPLHSDPDDLEKANLLLFPNRISKETLNVAVEWAAGTQTPIFCHSADVARFEAEGFGAYRFHRLDGFKEIDFQGGTVEFYPARRRPQQGIRGFFTEAGEYLGFLGTPSYHVLIRPRKEMAVLYLSSPYLEANQWELLNRTQPEILIGSRDVPRHEWMSFAKKVKKRIFRADDCGTILTAKTPDGSVLEGERGETWSVKAGSF